MRSLFYSISRKPTLRVAKFKGIALMSPPCHFSNKVLHKLLPYYKIDMLSNSNITKA